jgi:hypothetical protein
MSTDLGKCHGGYRTESDDDMLTDYFEVVFNAYVLIKIDQQMDM